MISYAFVDGFTRVAREKATRGLTRAIADVGGVIVDFAFFGREAIRLTVELQAAAVDRLRQRLEGAGVELFSPCLSELETARSMSERHPVIAMLHVAFLPPEADLPENAAHFAQ